MEINTKTLKDWKNFYTKIHKVGRALNAARERNMHVTNSDQFKTINQQLDLLTKRCSNFLDKEGYKLAKPDWIFDIHDQTTWLSSSKFDVNNLLQDVA